MREQLPERVPGDKELLEWDNSITGPRSAAQHGLEVTSRRSEIVFPAMTCDRETTLALAVTYCPGTDLERVFQVAGYPQKGLAGSGG